MTLLTANGSIQRTIVLVGVSLALLALPLMGAQHCQVMQDDQGHAATPLAEACCVFLCFTALVSLAIIPVSGLSLARAALHLKPVRLIDHLTRWVPPPRPIYSLA